VQETWPLTGRVSGGFCELLRRGGDDRGAKATRRVQERGVQSYGGVTNQDGP
jgi:hypothetical protein